MGMEQWALYGCNIDKSSTGNSNYMIADGLEVGYILAMIESQRKEVAAWLYHCYGDEYSTQRLSSVATFVRFNIFPISTARQHERWLALSRVAVDDYRLRIRSESAQKMPIAVYSAEMKTTENNFSRDWGKKKDQALDCIKLLDSEGIANVSAMIKAITGRSDYRPSQVLQNEGNLLP